MVIGTIHFYLGATRIAQLIQTRDLTAEEAGLGVHMLVAPKLPVAPIAPKTCSAEIAATA